jgi:3-hydroxyacyl-CoA dehydrogenase
MKIVGQDGRELPRDGIAFGDLHVRGPWVIDRYFSSDESPLVDGWFPTGDVATIDRDGFLSITDRSKDVIKSGGEWISSSELENVAVAHPEVAEAACIACRHPKWDERPLLVVVKRPGATLTREALLAFYEGKVAKWWIPDDVVFVDELPHTATGKLLKLKLRELFREHVLPTAGESAALQYAARAERAAGQIADVPDDTPSRPIARVAVIGAGTMGGGIAMNFVNAGIPVTLVESNADALERGLATIRRNYDVSVNKGKLSETERDARMARLSPTLAYDAVADADLIIEAVFEDMSVKEQVFGRIDALAKPGAILASNTSTLDLNRIARFTRRPSDVIGMHFFSPANVMKLLEVVRGEATAKDVLATVMRLAQTIGKTAVVSGVCDGFIGNRMIEQYFRQSLFMLEEGALPEQIDAAIERFGFAMGPFKMSDLAGNDISWAIRQRRYRESPGLHYPRVADRLCEAGRFGQKTSAGWYDYRPGEREPHVSNFVTEMIVDYSARIGATRRAIDDDEIVERLVYALVNEGAKILAEGIAAKATDIDVVYLNGYGFPVSRGGPMFYAHTVGLAEVERAIRRYATQANGDAWEVAPLLADMARTGRRFCE